MTKGLSAAVFACALALGVSPEHVTARAVAINVAPEQTFTISGHVANPGTYDVKEGLTVQQAIAQAGGLTPNAGRTRILLTRLTYGKLKTTSVKPGHRVQPGDKIVVESKP